MEPAVTLSAIAKMIDHSLLHPALTDREIEAGFALAVEYGTAAVCVKPYSVTAARESLAGSGVAVCAVNAFPHGNATVAIKVAEAVRAVADGATEIDTVVNIGKALGGDWDYVDAEIGVLNEAVTGRGALVKVIFETDFLDDAHIVRLCEICTARAAAFVKTSTGYGFVKRSNGFYSYAGATEHAVRLMRAHCPPFRGGEGRGWDQDPGRPPRRPFLGSRPDRGVGHARHPGGGETTRIQLTLVHHRDTETQRTRRRKVIRTNKEVRKE